jgi:hypothetical protein
MVLEYQNPGSIRKQKGYKYNKRNPETKNPSSSITPLSSSKVLPNLGPP